MSAAGHRKVCRRVRTVWRPRFADELAKTTPNLNKSVRGMWCHDFFVLSLACSSGAPLKCFSSGCGASDRCGEHRSGASFVVCCASACGTPAPEVVFSAGSHALALKEESNTWKC